MVFPKAGAGDGSCYRGYPRAPGAVYKVGWADPQGCNEWIVILSERLERLGEMSDRDDERQDLRDLERDLVAILDITPGLSAKSRRRDGLIAAIPIALLIGGLSTGLVQMDGPLWATGNTDTSTQAVSTEDQVNHSGPASAGNEISLTTPDIQSGQNIEPAGTLRAEARQPTRTKATSKPLLAARDKPSKLAASRILQSKRRDEQLAVVMPGQRSRESYDAEYAGSDWDDRDDDGGYDYDRRSDRGEYRRHGRDEDRGYDRSADSDDYRRRWRDEDGGYGRGADSDDYRRHWRDEEGDYGRGVDSDAYRRHWRDEGGGDDDRREYDEERSSRRYSRDEYS